MTIDKCAIARETDEFLTPETWTTDTLLRTWDGNETGDESQEVEWLKEKGTQRCQVCLVGALVRACFIHIPDYDWDNVEHHDLTMELAEVMARIIEPEPNGAFGTITNFNDETEYQEGDVDGEEEPINRFPKIKNVAQRFADEVCNREA